jgi:protein subunit release factor A
MHNHEDTIPDKLYGIHKTTEKMNYAGIFDNEEDAINAAKQFAKQEKREMLNMLEQELSSLIQNVESLKQELTTLG